jgi:L-galactose dehydrogenase
MRTRRLGRTNLQVSEISLGALFFGDLADEARSRNTIDRALESGINWIDTAAGYQASEVVVGQVLRGQRERVYLSTKYFPYAPWPEVDLRAASLQRAVEQSLTRLQTDVIDLFQLHWIPTVADLRAILDSDLPVALDRLRQQGKIRFIGLSNASEQDGEQTVLIEAVKSGIFDTVMCCYNLFFQTAERELFGLCQAHNIGVLVMMPLDQPADGYGLVSRKSARQSVQAMIARGMLPAAAPYTNADLFDFLLAPPAHTIPEAALRFALAPPAVSTVLSGTNNIQHLEANLAAADGRPLAPGVLARARQLFGQINEHKVRPGG